MVNNQKKHTKQLFLRALSEQVTCFCSEVLTKEEVSFLAKSVDWSNVTDTYIKYNADLLSKIDWKLHVNKHLALRIALSDLSDSQSIDKYPLHLYEYTFREVIDAVCIYPSILEHITIVGDIMVDHIVKVAKERPEFLTMYDFNTSDLTEEDIFKLMKVGNKDFNDSVEIDFSNLKDFDKFKLIKSNDFSQNILESTGVFCEEFNNPFYVRQIVIKTGDEYLDALNLDCLFPSDWIKILRQHRYLSDRINIQDFLNGDIYYLIDLCMMLPEYVEYITQENSHKISSLGWQKLLIKYGTDDDNRLVKLCDFGKIEQRSWKIIQKEKPELLLYKL